MEALLMVAAGGMVFVFLVLAALTVGLILGSGIVGVLGATDCALRHIRGATLVSPGSRLSVAMWSDIAAILDERR